MRDGETADVRFMQVTDITQVKDIEKECRISVWSFEDYEKEVDSENSVALVLEKKGEILGFLIARLIKTEGFIIQNQLESSNFEFEFEAEIYNIAVKIKYQGQGNGRKLMDKFLEICLRKKVKQIWLEVRKANKRAINFYVLYGFEFAHLRKNFYSLPQDDAMVLKREIKLVNSS